MTKITAWEIMVSEGNKSGAYYHVSVKVHCGATGHVVDMHGDGNVYFDRTNNYPHAVPSGFNGQNSKRTWGELKEFASSKSGTYDLINNSCLTTARAIDAFLRGEEGDNCIIA